MSCLDEVRLEQVAIGAVADPHAESCADCAARLEALRRETAHFQQYVYPATVDRVVARARRPRPARLWLLVAVPALAAAAGLLIGLRLPTAPGPDYLGVKGQAAVRLEAFGAGPAGPVALKDGQRVPADAALRFRVKPAAPCHLWLLSVDASGAVSRLYPVAGDEPAHVGGPTDLPGGAVLDGSAGVERFFAFCTQESLPWPDVEQAVRRGQWSRLGTPGSLRLEKVR